MYVEGDVPVMQGNCNRNDGAFGGDWWGGIIGLIAVAAIFGGLGNGGGLFGNRGSNGGGDMLGYQLGRTATSEDIAVGFAQNSTLSGLNDLKLGQAGIQQTLCQGFNGVNTSVLTSTNAIQSQLANCCCDIQRSIDSVNFNMAQNTCALQNTMNFNTRDIIQSQQAGTQRILDYLCNEKISALQAENQNLRLAASQSAQNAFIAANQEAQTAELIRRLGRDVPVPAYVVPNPNCCYGAYGYGAACGASVQ